MPDAVKVYAEETREPIHAFKETNGLLLAFDNSAIPPIVYKTDTQLELGWFYTSEEAAELCKDETATLWWTNDGGEEWHIFDDAVPLRDVGLDPPECFGSSNLAGVLFIEYGFMITGPPIDLGSEMEDSLCQFKLTINSEPAIEVYSKMFAYLWSEG